LRSKVRNALRELKQKGYLDTFEMTRDDRVMISKAKDTAIRFDSQILDMRKLAY
jgi:hypothetical protein